MENKKIIAKIINLEKFFINNNNVVKAIDNVSFDLLEGEIIGLIGESGSGKSTIAKSIVRLVNDYFGSIIIDGIDVSGKKIPKRIKKYLCSKVQMIFQDPYSSLNDKMNVFSIIKEAFMATGRFKIEFSKFIENLQTIKKMFKYELKIFQDKIDFENNKFKLKKLISFYETLVQDIEDFRINSMVIKTIREKIDNFVSSTFQKKFDVNAIIIKDITESLDVVIQKYLEYQVKFKNNNLEKDELFAKNFMAKYNKIAHFEDEFFELNKIINEGMKEIENDLFIIQNEKQRILINEINKYKILIKKKKDNINKSIDIAFVSEEREEILFYKWKINELKLSKPFLANVNTDDLVNFFVKVFNNNDKNKILQTINATFQKDKISKKSNEYKLKNLLFKNKKNFYNNYEKIFSNFKEKKPLLDLKRLIKSNLEKYQTYLFKSNFCFKKIVIYKNDLLIKLKLKKIISILHKQKQTEIIKAKEELIKNKLIYKENVAKWLKKQKLSQIEEKRSIEIMNLEKRFLEIKNAANVLFDSKILHIKQCILNCIKKVKNNEILNTKLKNINHKIVDAVNNENNRTLLNKLNFNYKKEKIVFIKKYKMLLEEFKGKIIKDNSNNNAFDIEYKLLNKDINRVKEITINKYQKIVSIWNLKKLFLKLRIKKILEDVGLKPEHAYRYSHEFSGGQKQRIAIARALISKPKILIADEPIAALDISIQAQIVNMLKRLTQKKGVSMIFIAHDLSMVEYIADKLQILHLGRVVERGDTTKIFANPIHPYTKQLFDAIPRISNANKKFVLRSFDEAYLKELDNNPSKYYNVEKDHEVLATASQNKEWNNSKNS